MKKFLIMMFLFICISNIALGAELTDVKEHWAKESIDRLIAADAINGYEDGTFKPDNNITVAEFLKILVQYTNYKKVLIGERWPDWYINTAKHYNFISENEFENYDRFITRYEVARILGRYINLEDVKVKKNAFSDTADESILKLATLEVANGYEDGTYRGDSEISRAEASVIICRAMKARRELVAKIKYSMENAEKLTNVGRNATYESDYLNRYEIKNNKIYFYDSGRYAKLDGYTINEKNIKNKTLINLIKSLIQEDAYVAVNYIPDKLLTNQIIVNYGTRESYVYNNSYAFGFIFYEDKPYELRRISMNNSLSEECFMKITVSRMWKDIIDMQNKEYAHELNNEKLLKALNAIFDKSTAKEMYNYIQEWIPKLYEAELGTKFVEVKKIGNYEVNLYTSGNSRVQLYISK